MSDDRAPVELQQQMRAVRGALEDNVDDFVESTKLLGDWKSYVYKYPVASVLATAAVGYLLVPNKRHIISPDADDLVRLAKRNKLVVQSNPKPQKQAGLTGTLFGLASSMLFRGLATYVGSQAGKFTGLTAVKPNRDQSLDRTAATGFSNNEAERFHS